MQILFFFSIRSSAQTLALALCDPVLRGVGYLSMVVSDGVVVGAFAKAPQYVRKAEFSLRADGGVWILNMPLSSH